MDALSETSVEPPQRSVKPRPDRALASYHEFGGWRWPSEGQRIRYEEAWMGIQHEDPSSISEATKDLIRARDSVIEEIQAQNYYDERIDATKDAELKRILTHNREEEKEHTAMLIEWLKEKDPTLAKHFEEHD
jgi:hypothetical protein